MDKQQARDIVRNTLGNPFDKAEFTRLAKELFNQIDESKAFHVRGYVTESYKKYVKTYERIATYTDPNDLKIDILIVYLQSETTLERARTSQRNFIAHYLKDRDQKDAGLVAFVSPDLSDWRFSLVKMDYQIDEKGKVKEEFTPARRWSFLVGTNENSHTAQSRLSPLIVDDTHNPTLAELEEAFNIETVTKEFFTEYRNLFIRVKDSLDAIVAKDATIKNNFEQNGVNTVDFAKKLLGQIVFLYFLQKKGWFGVQRDAQWGTGSKQFLRELFKGKHGQFNNFFNDILEPLFYDALSRDRADIDHWNDHFKCKIPFLNGGLFDPISGYDWVKTDILIPNELFSNNIKTNKGDTGDGVLDVFDRYNFTVKEDEPLEKEVAIDPELLGKAYEKFNAIRPDNFEEYKKALKSGKKGEESKFNKQFGVYYTPREIVHYMCQQSIISYLYAEFNGGITTYEKPGVDQTDMVGNLGKSGQLDLTIEHKEKPDIPKEDIETLIHYGERITENEAIAIIKEENINEGKQKTTKTKSFLSESIRNNAQEIDTKLASIRVCDPAIGSGAFPVGMMNEIVRARNVLSNFIKGTNRTIYNFKRECIENSLYGVDIDSGAVEIAKLRLWLSLVVDEDDIKNIKPLPNLDYKIVCGNSLIGFPEQWDSPVTKEIESLKHEFFDETNPTKKNELKRQIDGKINDRYKNSLKTFGYAVNFDFRTAFSEVFHEKGGFDAVIANPPYVGEKGHKEMFRRIASGPLKPFYQGKMDVFYFFFHLALNFSRSHGNVAFITTNYYITASGANKLRKDLKNRTILRRLVNFNELKIFESALGQHNMITILSKAHDKDAYSNNCITKRTGFSTSTILQSILSWNDKETDYFSAPQSDIYDGDECYIRLTKRMVDAKGGSFNHILNKLALQQPLDNVCSVNSGCDITISRITASHLKNFRGDFSEGDGVFVIKADEISNSHLNKNESSKLKNFIKNSDIKKFGVQIGSDKLVYLRWEDDIDQYPALRKHLARFKAILLDQAKRYEENYPWFAIHRPRKQAIFDSEQKILVPYRSKLNVFGYSTEKVYASRDVFFITAKDEAMSLKYIVALLNSKLYYLWLYHRGKRKGETLELYQQPLSEVPIKRLDKNQQKPFVDLVDRILAAKQRNPKADTAALEREIDQMVYALYDLTPEEIKTVEGSSSVK